MELDRMVAGFVVGSMSEVIDLLESAIQAPPALGGAIEHYVAGIGEMDERLLVLLNIQGMLRQEKTANSCAIAGLTG